MSESGISSSLFQAQNHFQTHTYKRDRLRRQVSSSRLVIGRADADPNGDNKRVGEIELQHTQSIEAQLKVTEKPTINFKL